MDNIISDSLTANVINLSILINPFYKAFIINELNRAKNDKDDPGFVDTIPSKAYFKLGENYANK
ncbi:hypothetical protein [Peloplasma aerotolerans]|uniref:Uncharacterized protein n=1 Tax=Peloplasma aerotolerans TaxID=3044389 RepID=A0AAW6U994_9MOLU|nr:hypothetical protein [Mariniplasma sp. M4Ah]MDI6452086.1 hypothetical protein [Mariniplasma sp. M4Ah]